jgi:hypothetical protein
MRLQKVKFMQNNSEEEKTIKIHGHCHQKSLSTMEATFAMLNVPKNSSVTIYNSGLLNGRFFGYEKNIMKSVCKWGRYLFPKIRATDPTTAIAGNELSHQILTEPQKSIHPVTIRSCLKNNLFFINRKNWYLIFFAKKNIFLKIKY